MRESAERWLVDLGKVQVEAREFVVMVGALRPLKQGSDVGKWNFGTAQLKKCRRAADKVLTTVVDV